MKWPLNWEPVAPGAKQALEAELRREVTPGHLLYSVPVEAIARRVDCDDGLFAVAGASAVAVVHLSYSPQIEPLWPDTQVFDNLAHWQKHAEKEQQ